MKGTPKLQSTLKPQTSVSSLLSYLTLPFCVSSLICLKMKECDTFCHTLKTWSVNMYVNYVTSLLLIVLWFYWCLICINVWHARLLDDNNTKNEACYCHPGRQLSDSCVDRIFFLLFSSSTDQEIWQQKCTCVTKVMRTFTLSFLLSQNQYISYFELRRISFTFATEIVVSLDLPINEMNSKRYLFLREVEDLLESKNAIISFISSRRGVKRWQISSYSCS